MKAFLNRFFCEVKCKLNKIYNISVPLNPHGFMRFGYWALLMSSFFDNYVIFCNSPFFKCSVTCGEGETTRRVVCIESNTNVLVKDKECNSETKPETSQVCQASKRCTSWRIGNWGHVSTLFGSNDTYSALVIVLYSAYCLWLVGFKD